MKSTLIVVSILFIIQGCSVSSQPSLEYKAKSGTKINVRIDKTKNTQISKEQLKKIKYQVQQGLKQKGSLASGRADHRVEITITSFKMRPDIARLTVGIMAGCDNIKSKVIVKNIRSGKELGRSDIEIKECAAWGVSDQVIAAYSKGIVNFLTK